MADKGTGFKNIRKSPAARLWRYLTAPGVNSWEDTLATEDAPQGQPDLVQTPVVGLAPMLGPQGSRPWLRDPYPNIPNLAKEAYERRVQQAPPLLRAPAVLATPQSIKAPRDYSNEPLMAAGRKDASSILYDAMPSTQARVTAGDAERRPYAYQQPAVRNAFTMGAPADDARARVMAAEAVKRFNAAEELYKSNKTPEAEASFREAQADADRWGKWAAMSPVARKQVLMNGERAANAAQGRENFASLRNEMDTPGAAELLSYAAKVNAGQIDASGNPISKYGSGQVVGYVPKGTQTAQTGINNYLKEYDPYDKRVDWATQPNEAGLTDEEIIKRSGGSASAAAKLADLRAMQRRQYLSDRGMTAASLLTGK